MNPIPTAIVDDMQPARAKLRRYLGADSRVAVVGEASNGRQATQLFAAMRPQIAFMDIQLPDGNGLHLIERYETLGKPIVIFVTAYDAYAVRAFELDARDYLLKPYTRERFDLALDRAIAQLSIEPKSTREYYVSCLTVKDRRGRHFIEVKDIDRIESDDHYLRFSARGRAYLLRGSLRELESRLDPTLFVRTHRSALVRVSSVRTIRPRGRGDYLIELSDGTIVPLGRAFHRSIRSRLGVTRL